MQPIPSATNLEERKEFIRLLENLGNLNSEYPPKLFAARRAAFLAQLDQQKKTRFAHELYSRNGFMQRPNK